MVLTLEREVDLYLVTSPVVGLNLTWHSAAGVVWGNVTVTMAEMWESFVKVELSWVLYEIAIANSIWYDCDFASTVPFYDVTPCRSGVLSDCGHRSSQWSTRH